MSTEKGKPSFFLSVLVTFVVFGAIATIVSLLEFDENRSRKRNLRAREALLIGIAGDEARAAHVPEQLRQVMENGRYVRKQFGQGVSLETIIASEMAVRSVIYVLSGSTSNNKVVEQLKKLENLPEPIINLAASKEWKAVRESKEDLVSIVRLLEGEERVPEFDYNDPPGLLSKEEIPWALLVTQFAAFGFYLARAKTSWYRMPWGKPGTYIVLAMLMPGALPLVMIAGFLTLCATDVGAVLHARRVRRAGGRPSPVKTVSYETARKSSEDLLRNIVDRIKR